MRVDRVCGTCGCAFVAKAHNVNRGRARFCSRECAGRSPAVLRALAAQHRTGAGNPSWKGGRSRNHYFYKRRFVERFPEKARAHRAVLVAIRTGQLTRPERCSQCATSCKPHGHHDDYSLPLMVRWLCRRCHRLADMDRRLHSEPPAYIEELLRVLGMRKSSFFALRKSGRFPIPELWPPIGGRPRWSRPLVRRYLAGQFRPQDLRKAG